VSTEAEFELEESLKRRFGTVADTERVAATASALEGNGIRAIPAANAADAKGIALDLIPDGSQVAVDGVAGIVRWIA